MTNALIQEILKYGIGVQLSAAISNDQDLGYIANSTMNVLDERTDPTVTPFTICHLFGHMVQCAISDSYQHLRDAVALPPPVLLPDSFWEEFYAYEREAFGYGAALLSKVCKLDEALARRYAGFMEVDFQHFRTFVSTCRRFDRTEYLNLLVDRYQSHPNETKIEPIPVPQFNAERLRSFEAIIY